MQFIEGNEKIVQILKTLLLDAESEWSKYEGTNKEALKLFYIVLGIKGVIMCLQSLTDWILLSYNDELILENKNIIKLLNALLLDAESECIKYCRDKQDSAVNKEAFKLGYIQSGINTLINSIERKTQDNMHSLIKKVTGEDYQEDFINYFHSIYCIPEYGCECNEHYIEGADLKDILGCCIVKHSEKEAIDIINTVIDNVDKEYYWEGAIGWKKIEYLG